VRRRSDRAGRRALGYAACRACGGLASGECLRCRAASPCVHLCQPPGQPSEGARARRHWRLAGCPTTEPREIHLAASGRCACEPERATAASAGARAALATAGRTRHHRRVVAIGVCANGAPRGLHGKLAAMNSPIPSLDSMNAAALRTMVLELLAEHGDLQQELALTQQLLTRQDQLVARQQDEIRYKEVRIAQL